MHDRCDVLCQSLGERRVWDAFISQFKRGVETPEEMVQAEEAHSIQVEGGGLATSCVSCCSCAVKAARVVLMLFSETFCLSVSSWRWCCRYPKASATPWEVSGGNDIWRADFLEGWVWQERATY